MGQELTTSQFRIKKFLGLNTRTDDTIIDIREAEGLQNVNITDDKLSQRNGSEKLHSVAFTNKAGVTTKNITGLYDTVLGTTRYRVGVGGDAFKQLTGGAWVDKTGSAVITDNDDSHWMFSTFFDNSASDIIIASNGVDAPFKFYGSGTASALSSPPGNFKYQVVHKNKLWVSVGDILYFSDLRNGESWDTTNDLIRYDNNGEDITGLYVYKDYIVVFQETAIYMVSGSSNRDLFSQKIVSGDGCASGYTIREVESARYGNILVFLSTRDGTIKGFNASASLIPLGDPVEPTFRSMNRSRYPQAVAENYKKLGQYWLALSLGGETENGQILIYDYKNDIYTNQETGKPLSSILYHNGFKVNAMAVFSADNERNILVTANYAGFALQQDQGQLDEEADTIESQWISKKMDFGSPNTIKMITDLNLVTTQRTTTALTLNVSTSSKAGVSTLSISPSGSLWGTMLWGTGLWSGSNTVFSRAELTREPSTEEGAVIGRYFKFELNHTTASEDVNINEMIIGVTNLGDQPEYTE